MGIPPFAGLKKVCIRANAAGTFAMNCVTDLIHASSETMSYLRVMMSAEFSEIIRAEKSVRSADFPAVGASVGTILTQKLLYRKPFIPKVRACFLTSK